MVPITNFFSRSPKSKSSLQVSATTKAHLAKSISLSNDTSMNSFSKVLTSEKQCQKSPQSSSISRPSKTKSSSAQPSNLQFSSTWPTKPSNTQPLSVQPSNASTWPTKTHPSNTSTWPVKVHASTAQLLSAQPSNTLSSSSKPAKVQPSNTQPTNAQLSNVVPSGVHPQPSSGQQSNTQTSRVSPKEMQLSSTQPSSTSTLQSSNTIPLRALPKKPWLSEVHVVLSKCSPVKKRRSEVNLSSSGDCKQLLTHTPPNNVIVISGSPAETNTSCSDVELIAPHPKRPCLIDLTDSPVVIVDTPTPKSCYNAEKSVVNKKVIEKRTANDLQDTKSISQNIESLKYSNPDPECAALMPENIIKKVLFAHSDMHCDATTLQCDCEPSMAVQAKCCDDKGTTTQHDGVTAMDLQTESYRHREMSGEKDGPSSTLVSAQQQPQFDSEWPPELDEDANVQFLSESNTKPGLSPGHESVASPCTTSSSINPLPSSTDPPSFVETETSIDVQAECCGQIQSKSEHDVPLQQQSQFESETPAETKDKCSNNQLSNKLQNLKTNFQLPMSHESVPHFVSVYAKSSVGKPCLTTETNSSMNVQGERIGHNDMSSEDRGLSSTVLAAQQLRSCSEKLSDKRSESFDDQQLIEANNLCTNSQLSMLKEDGSLVTSLSSESNKTCPLPLVEAGTSQAECYGHNEATTKDKSQSYRLVSTEEQLHLNSEKPSKKTDKGSNNKLPYTQHNSSANLQHSGDKEAAALISAENGKMGPSPHSVKSGQFTSSSTQVKVSLSTSASIDCNTGLLPKVADSAPVSSSSNKHCS